MAKTLASVKPVKVYGLLCGEHLDTEGLDSSTPTYNIPCTLLTTARYKKLIDVVKAAQKWNHDPTAHLNDRVNALEAAIEAAEKAGAL